ncbi:hypothetical protein ACFYWY_27225 [Streptomyces sp. NPDC002870]|uniref:hypothetical protein n=1 Tax=Streptomyces sp. NPDC002870 TaxID=3364666 RepID=UPI00368FB7E3
MSLFTRSCQLPDTDKATTEEGLTPDDTAADQDDPDEAVAGDGRRGRHPAAARAVTWVTTALAAMLVIFALLLPNELTRLTPGAFARIPVEGILGAALLLVLPPRARRVATVLAGMGLGVLTILNFLDIGFYSSLDRPFDLMLDWILFDDAQAFLRDSVGQAGAIGAVIGVVVLVLALLVLMTLAVVRLSHLMVRHSTTATRTILVLGTAWITCAALGVQIAGAPLASRSNGRARPGPCAPGACGPDGRAGVRQGGSRRRLPRHSGRSAADRAARQGRHLRLRRELRPQRGPTPGARPTREPLMAEIILVSSHNPWAPLPKMIGWDEVGDGSVYDAMNMAGKDPKEVWKDPNQVRTEYRRSIEYSLSSLISYMEKYGDENTVLVFLGDHQPAPIVTGDDAGRDVPIAIVAHDPAVMDRISGWGWQDGLKPGPKAPVWRMDTFRDRFLTAYGQGPGPERGGVSRPPAGREAP